MPRETLQPSLNVSCHSALGRDSAVAASVAVAVASLCLLDPAEEGRKCSVGRGAITALT